MGINSLYRNAGKGGTVKFNTVFAFFIGLILCACSNPVKQSVEEPSMEHLHKTYTEYDRFKDETDVFSANAEVTSGLFMGFVYGCHGKSTECDPGVVMVTFWTGSPNRFADSHDVDFLADSLRFHPPGDFGRPRWQSMGTEHNFLSVGLEAEDFLKLIHAHSVEGRFGLTEFTVQENDLQNWRMFASGIQSGVNSKRKP